MTERTLPALPPSDPASMAQNRWDANNETRSASFWQGNQVTHIEDKPFTKCKHYFQKTTDGARCIHCHFGLVSNLTVQDGKLLISGRLIEL